MNEELDTLLCEHHPLIFAKRNNQSSCMSSGFACGDGWFDLIDTLCERLQSRTACNGPQVVVEQVKEKLGALRFHVDQADDWQRGMIDIAEAMSMRICEQCGQPGRLLQTRYGLLTRCAAHAPENATPVCSLDRP